MQTVADFYSKWYIKKENVVQFIKLGQSFQDKTLLEAAATKFAEHITSMDVEIGAEVEPAVLSRILVIFKAKYSQDHDSNRLSQLVAACISNATSANLTSETFRLLTDESTLPSIEPTAAIKLLASQNIILNCSSQALASDPTFHERCVSSIVNNWESIRKLLEDSTELANTMRLVSSVVLFDILMKANATQEAETPSSHSVTSITF